MDEFTDQEIEQATSVITCDLEGLVKTYSRGAEKLFGYAPDEIIDTASVGLFHTPENVATLVPRLLKTAVETGKFEEEVVMVKKDKTQFRATLAVRPVHRGGAHVGYMGITRPLE